MNVMHRNMEAMIVSLRACFGSTKARAAGSNGSEKDGFARLPGRTMRGHHTVSAQCMALAGAFRKTTPKRLVDGIRQKLAKEEEMLNPNFDKLSKPISRLIFNLLLVAAFMVPHHSKADQIAWESVSVYELDVIFRGESLGLNLVQSRRAWVASMQTSVEYSVWRNDSKYAMIIKWSADPGRTFLGRDLLDDKANIQNTFGYINNMQIDWGNRETFSGPLGVVDTQFLKAERDNCIVWAFGYNIAGSGRSWSDSVTDIVRGLYCQEEEIELEFAEEVVLLSGYKGGYVPPGP